MSSLSEEICRAEIPVSPSSSREWEYWACYDCMCTSPSPTCVAHSLSSLVSILDSSATTAQQINESKPKTGHSVTYIES